MSCPLLVSVEILVIKDILTKNLMWEWDTMVRLQLSLCLGLGQHATSMLGIQGARSTGRLDPIHFDLTWFIKHWLKRLMAYSMPATLISRLFRFQFTFRVSSPSGTATAVLSDCERSAARRLGHSLRPRQPPSAGTHPSSTLGYSPTCFLFQSHFLKWLFNKSKSLKI